VRNLNIREAFYPKFLRPLCSRTAFPPMNREGDVLALSRTLTAEIKGRAKHAVT